MVQYSKRHDSMKYIVNCMHKIIESMMNKDLVSFGGGSPDKATYPINLINEITKDILSDENRAYQTLGYGSTIGLPLLREMTIEHLLVPNNINVALNEIMITSGGIQAIDLVCKLFLDPDDVVLVESPTFIHAKMIFDSYEAKTISCSMDQDGLNLEELKAKIKLHHPKIIYTMPTFHNPTGISMSEAKREQIASIANDYNVIVLEDDPYAEIRYSDKNFRPIKSYDNTGNVIYANSFSKIFSPGARLGYLVANADIIQELVDMKLAADTCTNGLTQAICAEFLKRGHYKDHIKKLCSIYKSKRDILEIAVDNYFPEGTKRTAPDGGFYVWVELPNGLDGKLLLADAIAKTNITYGTGGDFFIENNDDGNQYLRLSFAGIEENIIEESIASLGNFFKSTLT